MFSEFCKAECGIMSIYDLAALCCSYIARRAADIEMFIGEYIMFDETSENGNPNFMALKGLQEEVYILLRKRKGEEFHLILEEILRLHDGLKLIPFLEKESLELTKVYFILLAIDRYIGSQKCLKRKGGPLNRAYIGDYYIYTKYEYSLLDHAKEELRFSPPIEAKNFNSDLEHIIAVPSKMFLSPKEPMQMRCIPNNQGELGQGEKLRVAVIPFNGFKMMEFPQKMGGMVYARYIDGKEEIGIKRALVLLDRAVREGANIVIFPEYVCSTAVQDAIRKHLKNAYQKLEKGYSGLLLVVAGSAWEEDNNIVRLFDRMGDCVGEYYKHTRFHDNKRMEGLREPGKKSAIVNIQDIGLCMPAICRDVSDGSDISEMMKLLRPFMLFVPAWSTSVKRGFQEQFKKYAQENYTTCILCNSCEPVVKRETTNKKKKTICNLVVTPHKTLRKSCVEGSLVKLERHQGCDKDCLEEGCIFIVDLDYSPVCVKKKEMTTWKQIKCRI